jgi:AraC family transcriptional activator of pyochelin receptor
VAAGLPSTLFSRPAFIPLPIQACLRSIMATAANPDGMALYLRSKVMELLAHQSLHSTNENTVRQRIVKTDYDRERLLFAKEYMLQRMVMPPSLADLARIAGINEFKLKRGFKELFGNTVFGYLTDARLDLALSELEKGRKTITEIAFELGFSSLQHFSTAFKKRHGIAPTRFKQP